MSDHTKAAGGSDSFGGSGVTRPQDPHQLQKMGNWKHINSILGPSVPRNTADNADVHKDEYASKGQSLRAQFGKSKKNSQIPEPGSSAMMSDAVESVIAGKGTTDMAGDCQIKENTRAFEAERMILSKTSVCRMESSFADCKNTDSSTFLHSRVASSQWQQYAEFNVNKKTESLVRSKRKYCQDERLGMNQSQTTCNECALAPDELKHMLEKFQVQGECMVHLSRLYRFVEKKRVCQSVSLSNDSTGSTSGCKLHGFCRIEDAGPSVFTGDEDNHPVSGVSCKEKPASCNCLDLESEISEHCNHSFVTNSEKKRDEKLIWGCSWPILNNQSSKACGDSPMDVSGRKLFLTKRSSMQGSMKLKESLLEKHFQQSMPGFSIHKLRRWNILGSVGRPLGISISDEKDGGLSVDAYSMDVRNESDVGITCLDMDVHVKSLSGGMYLPTSDEKESMATKLMLRTGQSHVLPEFRFIPFYMNWLGGPLLAFLSASFGLPSINTQVTKATFQLSFVGQEMLVAQLAGEMICPASCAIGWRPTPQPTNVADFTAMQKPRKSETTCQDLVGIKNPINSESTSALQMKEATFCNQGTDLPASLDLFPCIDTADTMEPDGLSISKTDTIDISSDVGKPESSGSGHQPEDPVGTDVSSRWVKRLKVNSDSGVIGTGGKNKMEDAITTQRVDKLFSRVMNYTRSSSFTMAKCLQERQQFQKTKLLLRNGESPIEPSKESHPWIQRWCQKVVETGCPRTRKAIEVLYEPENAKQLPENLEGKLFPSLAAMALMGKAFNNFRPCEFRRRGSSLVWNTEGFRDQNILLQGAGSQNGRNILLSYQWNLNSK
ncbi:hypothetical protein Taro_025122 [Colocasia esculenta]|uniref:Uncharacterized protein n=1 Tax=Colocasia esculenta TaxID=4460 RepID=A0A843VMF1_COLES|nr:hypothetical protein [Colocasia esculenta]